MNRSGDNAVHDQSDHGYVSLDTAIAWIDAATPRLPTEQVLLCNAPGRVLSENSRAGSALPPCDRAALDGFAVRAQDSFGASVYNPTCPSGGRAGSGRCIAGRSACGCAA